VMQGHCRTREQRPMHGQRLKLVQMLKLARMLKLAQMLKAVRKLKDAPMSVQQSLKDEAILRDDRMVEASRKDEHYQTACCLTGALSRKDELKLIHGQKPKAEQSLKDERILRSELMQLDVRLLRVGLSRTAELSLMDA